MTTLDLDELTRMHLSANPADWERARDANWDLIHETRRLREVERRAKALVDALPRCCHYQGNDYTCGEVATLESYGGQYCESHRDPHCGAMGYETELRALLEVLG